MSPRLAVDLLSARRCEQGFSHQSDDSAYAVNHKAVPYRRAAARCFWSSFERGTGFPARRPGKAPHAVARLDDSPAEVAASRLDSAQQDLAILFLTIWPMSAISGPLTLQAKIRIGRGRSCPCERHVSITSNSTAEELPSINALFQVMNDA